MKYRQVIEKNQSFGLKQMPVGFWNYVPVDQFPEHITEAEVEGWAECGFNLAKSPIFNPDVPEEKALMAKVLDWCRDREIKVIVRDGRIYGDRIDEAIKDYGADPAVLGFHIVDEPIHEMNDRAFATNTRLKKKAPHMLGYINLGRYMPGVEEWAGYKSRPDYLDRVAVEGNVDFLCYDCYEQMNPGTEGWDQWFDNLRLTREASLRNGIPFWVTPLCVGHFHFRCPSYDDLRWQFNTAVCSGATGITWYRYYERDPKFNARFAPVNEFWEKTHTYYDMRLVHKAFHRRYGGLFMKLVPTRVTFTPFPYGNGQAFTPNEMLLDVSSYEKDRQMLIGEFTDLENKRYIMIVNNSCTENVHCVIKFPSPKTRIFSYDWNGKEYEGPAYCVFGHHAEEDYYVAGYWLSPGQELVQRIEAPHLKPIIVG